MPARLVGPLRRKGMPGIRVKFHVKAGVPDEELEELFRAVHTLSPVYDTITRAVPVKEELEKD